MPPPPPDASGGEGVDGEVDTEGDGEQWEGGGMRGGGPEEGGEETRSLSRREEGVAEGVGVDWGPGGRKCVLNPMASERRA